MSAPLADADITTSSARLACHPAALRAVIEVECRGSGFTEHGGEDVPVILFEPHVFFQRSGVHPVSRDFPHLSSRRWNARLYNASGRDPEDGESRQHLKLAEASALDAHYQTGTRELRDAAHESCSWGLGQVMGYHWRGLGYPSLEAFLDAMRESESAQLDAMLRFLDKNGLLDALRRGDRTADSWRPLARGYNGAGYWRHRYHERLASAYRTHGGP